MKIIELCSFWSKDKLIQRCQEIGTRAFDRGFRQKAITADELTFPNFTKCVRKGESPPMWQYTFTGVDLSGEKRKGNVIITIAVNNDGYKYPIDIRTGEWTSPQTADQIKEVNEIYKPIVVHVENNAYQNSILEWMREKGYGTIPLKAFTTGKQKSDSDIGLPSLDVQFEQNNWRFYLPDHQAGCRCPWCQFEREVSQHPGCVTTDCVMALWFAERAYKMYGVRRGVKEQKASPGITAGLRGKQW